MAEGQGMFDKAKKAAEGMKEKLGDVVERHEDKNDSDVDKTGDVADDKTGGRFGEKTDSAQDAVEGAVDPVSSEEDPEQPGNAPL